MDVGVGVGGTIVQDKFFGAGARFANQVVEFHLGPLLETRGFALRQVRLLGEPGLRQVDGFFQIEWRGFSRHKPRCSQEKDTNSLLRAESKP